MSSSFSHNRLYTHTPAAQSVSLSDSSILADVPDDVIAVRAAASVQKAVWTMNRVYGTTSLTPTRLYSATRLFDLDVTAAELYRVLNDLRPLSEEWTQRDRKGTGMEQQQASLFLNQPSD